MYKSELLTSSMKPLFIPLKSVYFEMFREGIKTTEFRLYGPRWNEKTCPPGRPVTLSKGYGKHARLAGTVQSFKVDEMPWLNAGFVACYGNDRSLRGACIKIRLSQT